MMAVLVGERPVETGACGVELADETESSSPFFPSDSSCATGAQHSSSGDLLGEKRYPGCAVLLSPSFPWSVCAISFNTQSMCGAKEDPSRLGP